MANYIRGIVSGGKARFRDDTLNVDLDLAYITDHVIVMGYPAAGLEGFYRNRREDAKRFLEHKHRANYWVFNFCPVSENSYSSDFFDGRVSRYPFPDHHAPPLAILPLVAREMRVWLDGSTDRVAVLHCKAGKGRSGTMACSYLLALDVTPTPPRLERSMTTKDWAARRADEWMEVMPGDETEAEAEPPVGSDQPDDPAADAKVDAEQPVKEADTKASSTGAHATPLLADVLALHTARRMKTVKEGKKAKQGVSIPSQRRWLSYWSLILAQQAPGTLWGLNGSSSTPQPRQTCRINALTVRMREPVGMKAGLVRAANVIFSKTKDKDKEKFAHLSRTEAGGGGIGQVWASLARYDDDLVRELERWERETRDGSERMGRRKADAGVAEIKSCFGDDRWDKGKMVRSFARMGALGDGVERVEADQEGKVHVHTLRPLSDSAWVKVKKTIKEDGAESLAASAASGVQSETNSVNDLVAHGAKSLDGVVVDAHREVRVKLYIGQIFMGWFWFIPAFHLPPNPASSTGGTGSPTPSSAALVLTRKEVDFPLGAGELLIDVSVALEWCPPSETEAPAARSDANAASAEEIVGNDEGDGDGEPVNVAPVLVEALAAGDVKKAIDAVQAAEE